MEIIIILLIALSLALDCFAVSICIGSSNFIRRDKYIIIPLHFGLFQMMMILLGFYLGSSFKDFIKSFDHWIAFILLLFIGIKLIIESLEDSCNVKSRLKETDIVLLAIATSIDALAVGITFSLINGDILLESIIIGIISFILGFAGLIIGKFGKRFNPKYVGIAGGIILISIGTKILLSHLGLS